MLLPFGGAVAYGIEPIFAAYGLEAGMPAPVGVIFKTMAVLVGFVAYLRFADTLPTVHDLRSTVKKFFVLAGLGNTVFLLGCYVALGLASVSVIVPILPASRLFTVALSALFIPERLERVTAVLFGVVLIVAGVIALTVTS